MKPAFVDAGRLGFLLKLRRHYGKEFRRACVLFDFRGGELRNRVPGGRLVQI